MSDFRMDCPEHVREQYRDPVNLGARSELHRRFSTNAYGWYRWVFDHLDLADGARVLEVGSGLGGLWSSQLPRVGDGWHIVLADLSPGMAAQARSTISDARFSFLVADAQSLPFAGGEFDQVIANHMLYHVPDLDAALEELGRVLRPGGRIFASTNGEVHLKQLSEFISDDAYRVSGFSLESGVDPIASHFSEVVVERYPDGLAVTEAEPLVQYMRSLSLHWRADRSEDKVRREVIARIERDGVFAIDKDPGLITGVRP